jgi:hypothetical protein
MAKKPSCIHFNSGRKLQLRQELHDIVYDRTHTKFEERINEIRTKNMVAMNYSWDGFTYQGEYYGMTPEPPPPTWTVFKRSDGTLLTKTETAVYRLQLHQRQVLQRNQKLHDSLVPAMDLLLAEREKVLKVEGAMVMSTIGSILNLAKHIEDYKRLLPQLLHEHLNIVALECECQVPRMTDKEIDAAVAKYGHYINAIKKRQLLYVIRP